MMKFLIPTLVSLGLLTATYQVKAGEILPQAVDLQATATVAKSHKVPVILFMTATWCHYCERLKENIMFPMMQHTRIEDYAEFREVYIDRPGWNIRDFDGNPLNMKEFAKRYKVFVTPTTLFLNEKGEIIADTVLGLGLEEHYPVQLDRSMNKALEVMGSENRINVLKLIGAEGY